MILKTIGPFIINRRARPVDNQNELAKDIDAHDCDPISSNQKKKKKTELHDIYLRLWVLVFLTIGNQTDPNEMKPLLHKTNTTPFLQ